MVCVACMAAMTPVVPRASRASRRASTWMSLFAGGPPFTRRRWSRHVDDPAYVGNDCTQEILEHESDLRATSKYEDINTSLHYLSDGTHDGVVVVEWIQVEVQGRIEVASIVYRRTRCHHRPLPRDKPFFHWVREVSLTSRHTCT